MPDVLDAILEKRKKSLSRTKERQSFSEIDKQAAASTRVIDFRSAIRHPGEISLIAEMKRKSPSAGVIRPSYDVAAIAAAYQAGGARALSVLAEEDYFGGSIDDVAAVSRVSKVPVLRKDFIFDPYQVVEAKAFGADAILLIAEMLDAAHLKELVQVCREYKIEPLVEIFTHNTLTAVLMSGATVIGINTRNLRTLEMFPNNVSTLSMEIPRDCTVVAESGMKTEQDIRNLKPLNVSAVLIGESILKQTDLAAATRRLAEAGRLS